MRDIEGPLIQDSALEWSFSDRCQGLPWDQLCLAIMGIFPAFSGSRSMLLTTITK